MAATDSVDDVQDDLVAKDLPELIALLGDFKSKISEVFPSIQYLQDNVDSEDMNTKEGISFLEVKFHLLLKYIINIVLVMLMKIDGESLIDAPVVERLVEIRTILEKIKPIDQRLKYQIDKLVKQALLGASSAGALNPLSFKPNPDNMSSKMDDEEGSSEEENTGIYVPPKVAAVPYEDDTLENRKKKHEERSRMKSLNKSLIKDLREEYSETPEEIKEDYKSFRRRRNEDDEKEKERYEEDNLIRLSFGKKSKVSRNDSSSKDLTKFGSFDFDSENEDGDGTYKKRNKKDKFSGKGKAKKGKFAFKKKKKKFKK